MNLRLNPPLLWVQTLSVENGPQRKEKMVDTSIVCVCVRELI